MTLRKSLPVVLFLTAIVWVGSAPAIDDVKEGFIAIFNGKDLSGFKPVLRTKKRDKTLENIDTFTVKDGAIVFSGKPNGYLHTEKSYKNYVLRFDWKFLKDGVTAVALHLASDSVANKQVWPTCVLVEGGPEKGAGRMFGLTGGFGIEHEKEFRTDRNAQKKAVKIGEWNTTEVVSKDGELICKINGVEVSRGKWKLTEGAIGWLSEGGKLLYKNIRIKVLE